MISKKGSVEILSVDEKTAGGRHYWCTAKINGVVVKIKKPVGAVKDLIKK